MTCPDCNQEIHTGSWPWCPHGVSHFSAIPDEFIGGFVQQNFGDKEEHFYSKRAMAKRADELNLRQVSDGDKKKGQYGVTAKMLADAKALLERGGKATDKSRATLETLTFTVKPL